MLCQEDPMTQTPKEKWIQLNSEALCQEMEYKARAATRAKAIEVTAVSIPELYCKLTRVSNEGLFNLSKKDQAEHPICCLTLKALESGFPELLLAADSPKEA